jgi:hypothetical protein
VTIKFFPTLNKDLFSKFSILSEHGPIEFPLECTYKKAIVRVKENIVDFGKMISGENGIKYIRLNNEGALTTSIKIKNLKGETLRNKTETISNYSRAQSQVLEDGEGN